MFGMKLGWVVRSEGKPAEEFIPRCCLEFETLWDQPWHGRAVEIEYPRTLCSTDMPTNAKECPHVILCSELSCGTWQAVEPVTSIEFQEEPHISL